MNHVITIRLLLHCKPTLHALIIKNWKYSQRQWIVYRLVFTTRSPNHQITWLSEQWISSHIVFLFLPFLDRRPTCQLQSIGGSWSLGKFYRQVEMKFHSRESHYQSFPWDLGISPPSSSILRLSRTILLMLSLGDILNYLHSWNNPKTR